MNTNSGCDIRVEINFEHESPETSLYMALGLTHGEFYYGPDYAHGWDFVLGGEEERTLLPSGAVHADLNFLNPHYHLGEIAVGTKFWIRRGQYVQGYGHVIQILNLEQAARKRAHYDLPVEVTFLQPAINNPSRFYSLFYGKHLNAYDLHQGEIYISQHDPYIHIKKKGLLIKSSIRSTMLHEPVDNVYQRLNQQPEWLILDHYAHDPVFSQPTNSLIATGQGIQLLETSRGSIKTNLIIEAKQALNAKERLHGSLSFIYGTIFNGENYKLNGTERLLILEEGQTVTLGQPVRGHLDLYGIAEHIEALPSDTEFVLRADDQTIAKGRVI